MNFVQIWIERLWTTADNDKLVGVGLAPSLRRQATFAIFVILSILFVVLIRLLFNISFSEMVWIALLSAIIGCVAGYMLHHFSSGKDRINNFSKDCSFIWCLYNLNILQFNTRGFLIVETETS